MCRSRWTKTSNCRYADAAMKQTIHDILKFFREEAANNRDLGDKFERLIAAYLTKDPFYAGLFGGKVWLWTEWPRRGNKPDTGIDIEIGRASGRGLVYGSG